MQTGHRGFAYVKHTPVRKMISLTLALVMCLSVMAMGVSEMLIQSREGSVTLLPALPECFPEGSFKGACCRGGIRVDFSWKAGRPDFVEATAIHDTETDFIFREKRVRVFLPAGQPRRVCWP